MFRRPRYTLWPYMMCFGKDIPTNGTKSGRLELNEHCSGWNNRDSMRFYQHKAHTHSNSIRRGPLNQCVDPPEWRWFVTHLVTANFYSCARASLFFGTSAQLHRNSLISHSPPIIKPDKGIKTKHSARVCTVVSLKRLVEWFVDKTKPSLRGAGSGSHFLK